MKYHPAILKNQLSFIVKYLVGKSINGETRNIGYAIRAILLSQVSMVPAFKDPDSNIIGVAQMDKNAK
ncbi:MAG: hypothetical protein ABJA57_07650 [Ginsengibacter sp.]